MKICMRDARRLGCTILLLACFSTACLEADETLLCKDDDDCPTGETCELVSGLCSPSASVSRFPSDLETGRFGSSGAFDCPIVEPASPGEALPVVAPGRATVLLSIDERQSFCDDATAIDTALGPRTDAVSSLRTGCIVSRRSLSVGRPGEQTSLTLYQLEFSQIDTTADNRSHASPSIFVGAPMDGLPFETFLSPLT